MYIIGEHLAPEAILSPKSIAPGSHSGIYEVACLPGLLARNRRFLDTSADIEPVYQDLTEALFKLDDFGIRTAGIGVLATKKIATERREEIEVYSTTQFISGLNMHTAMINIPFSVLRNTVTNILTYYEQMTQDYSDALYFADVSLRQFIYGKPRAQKGGTLDDSEPESYFIDHEPRLSNLKTHLTDQLQMRIKTGRGFRGFTGLDDDLWALKQCYPDENYDHIAKRLLYLGQSIGAVYWVPSAWYHMHNKTDLADSTLTA